MQSKRVITAALVLCFSAIASAQSILVPVLLHKLEEPEFDAAPCEARAAIVALHEMGTEALPALIARISDDSKWKAASTLLTPTSSQIPPEHFHGTYRGVLYAYVVELILGRAHLERNFSDCSFLFASDLDYLSKFGVIRKKDRIIQPDDKSAHTQGDLTDIRPIEASDMEQVRSVYLAWWRLNANRPLEQLRSDWQAGKRPLSGSKYVWQ